MAANADLNSRHTEPTALSARGLQGLVQKTFTPPGKGSAGGRPFKIRSACVD